MVACDCVEAGHGAEERMAVPLNWKGSLSFQLFLITFSTISVPSVATKARGKTFACNAVFQVFPSVVHVALASHLMVGACQRYRCMGWAMIW